MNAKKKEKAVKDFAPFANLEIEELTAKLVEAGYDEEKEIPEIIAELKGEKPTQTQKFGINELFETESEEGEIVFAECDNWKQYQKEVSKLNGSKDIDYIKVNAVGCFRKKENSKGNKVPVMVGLKLVNGKVECKTRINPQTAERLNSQIWNTNNLPSCSIYYLVESLIEY